MMKIIDIHNLLSNLNEGFVAWHSSRYEFDEFRQGAKKGAGLAYGLGIYLEKSNAKNNFLDYCKGGSTQYKVWVDLDIDENFLNLKKTLSHQNISLDMENYKKLFPILKSDIIVEDKKSTGNLAKDTITLVYYAKKLLSIISASRLKFTIYEKLLSSDCRDFLTTLKNKGIFTFNTSLEDWKLENISNRMRDVVDLDLFYDYFKEIKKAAYTVCLYGINHRLKFGELLKINILNEKETQNIIKKVWPQMCGVKAEESSLGGETKDRMYVIVWDEKFVKILGKRKKIDDIFNDEMDDKLTNDYLNNMQ